MRKTVSRKTQHDLLSRTVDPRVMVGKPCLRGLRITVEQILKALAAGVRTDELIAEYPELETDDIQAALLYAAELVGDERLVEISASQR